LFGARGGPLADRDREGPFGPLLLLPVGPDYVGTRVLKEEEHTGFFTDASVDVHFPTRLAHI
jgi:hypothetical protein